MALHFVPADAEELATVRFRIRGALTRFLAQPLRDTGRALLEQEVDAYREHVRLGRYPTRSLSPAALQGALAVRISDAVEDVLEAPEGALAGERQATLRRLMDDYIVKAADGRIECPPYRVPDRLGMADHRPAAGNGRSRP